MNSVDFKTCKRTCVNSLLSIGFTFDSLCVVTRWIPKVTVDVTTSPLEYNVRWDRTETKRIQEVVRHR